MTRCACTHARVYVIARAYARVRVHLYAWPSMDFQAKRVRFSKFCRGWPGAFCERNNGWERKLPRGCVWMPKESVAFPPSFGGEWTLLGCHISHPSETTSHYGCPCNIYARPFECVAFHSCMWESIRVCEQPHLCVDIQAYAWASMYVCGCQRANMDAQSSMWTATRTYGHPNICVDVQVQTWKPTSNTWLSTLNV